MRRRDVLAGTGLALASAVAGCLAEGNSAEENGNGEQNGNENANGDENGTANGEKPGTGNSSPGEFERQVTVSSVDDLPDSVPVEFHVGVTDSTIDAAGTASLDVAVTNTGETEREVPSPYYKGISEGDRQIMLYSLEAPDSPDRGYVPPCIEDQSPSQQSAAWTDEGPLSHALDPDESGVDELLVRDDPSAEGCFPPGQYRFEERHSVDGTEFTWGFTVEITDTSGRETPAEPADRRYEECSREVIPYDVFPGEIQAEIDAALDGRYEADRVYLREAMDVEESYISVDEEYYEATVTVEDGSEVLELALVEPKALPRERPIKVGHNLDSKRAVTAELVAPDGTVLVDRTREIHPGGEWEFGRTTRVGNHQLTVTLPGSDEIEEELTATVSIRESRFSVIARVEKAGLRLGGAVADLGNCRYDS